MKEILPTTFDPTEWKTACRKCEKHKSPMNRHHKGNDLFFAKMLPDVFAPRYLLFHPDDIAKLCEDCHHDAHGLYKPITLALMRELNENGIKIITPEWCNRWRAKYVSVFDKWVKVKPRKRRRKRHRRRSSRLTTKRKGGTSA